MEKKLSADLQESEADITPQEKALLEESLFLDPLSGDDLRLKHSQLDSTDFDGEPLNEHSSADDFSGNDLDIPPSDEQDNIDGDDDEENSGYSVADTE